MIDLHLGLYGETSSEMSVVQGLWGLSATLLLGWWIVCIVAGAKGDTPSLRAALVVTAVQWLVNGPVALVAAPPPSDAFPWQDVSHFWTLLAGVAALRLTWVELTDRPRVRGRTAMAVTVVLIVAAMALGAPLNLDAITSG